MPDDSTITQDWADAAAAALGVDWDDDHAGVVLALVSQVTAEVGADAGAYAAFLLGLAVGHGHPIGGAAKRLREVSLDEDG